MSRRGRGVEVEGQDRADRNYRSQNFSGGGGDLPTGFFLVIRAWGLPPPPTPHEARCLGGAEHFQKNTGGPRALPFGHSR